MPDTSGPQGLQQQQQQQVARLGGLWKLNRSLNAHALTHAQVETGYVSIEHRVVDRDRYILISWLK